MKKQTIYIIIGLIAALVAGWFGRSLFTKKNQKAVEAGSGPVSARDFISNSCWVYHEYVYRVEFAADTFQSTLPLFFIRNHDGTFSPSSVDESGNQVTGNGFIIDSTGACLVTDQLNEPWRLTEEEKAPLKDMVNEWLSLKPGYENVHYNITGQTIALFVVLNDPKEFIEYTVSYSSERMMGGKLIYPHKRILMKGLGTQHHFEAIETGTAAETGLAILKTELDEKNPENPAAVTLVDSISAIVGNDGYLDGIKNLKGDGLFSEGSSAFDQDGNWIGILSYKDQKWRLLPVTLSMSETHSYRDEQPAQQWLFDQALGKWKRLSGTSLDKEEEN